MTTRLDREVIAGDGIHAVFDETGLAYSIGLGWLPKVSPYKVGDWVRYHGYDVAGFRGFVLGGRGGTLLFGLTDDGREWCEHFGHLDPDVPMVCMYGPHCTCCPREDIRRENARPVDLLDLLAGVA